MYPLTEAGESRPVRPFSFAILAAASGESFGMIVQAKRLYVDEARWSFKFNHNSGEQRRALFDAAATLDVVQKLADALDCRPRDLLP